MDLLKWQQRGGRVYQKGRPFHPIDKDTIILHRLLLLGCLQNHVAR